MRKENHNSLKKELTVLSETKVVYNILKKTKKYRIWEFLFENPKEFIEEDGNQFWTEKSFSFEEILGMGFVE